jgi:hypothetical protein
MQPQRALALAALLGALLAARAAQATQQQPSSGVVDAELRPRFASRRAPVAPVDPIRALGAPHLDEVHSKIAELRRSMPSVAFEPDDAITFEEPKHEEEKASGVVTVEAKAMSQPAIDVFRFRAAAQRHRRGFFKSVGKAIVEGGKKLLNSAKDAFKKNIVDRISPPPHPHPPPPPPPPPPPQPAPVIKMRPEDIEDCTACRWVWLSIEAQVGNSQVEQTVYDAFTTACIEAQKAPIFYKACEDMFDDVYGMIGDYIDGYTVNQVCEGAKMCR